MEQGHMFDVIGIGVGPYNLSMAALLDDVSEINAAFFEQSSHFDWHPGMLINNTDLQVPFLADLVTFGDPTSPYTYLNYLHKHHRLYKFYFYNRFQIPRQEYNHYAQWVAGQLDNCFFGREVVDIIDKTAEAVPHYQVVVQDQTSRHKDYYSTRHVVMGTGINPLIIDGMNGFPEKDVLHTSRYLHHKKDILNSRSITIIGSGQSGAEVFWDLLKAQEYYPFKLSWLTRSEGILQLEASKLGQEFFSPDYVDYFHRLSYEQRKSALSMLEQLRKGVDPDTLNNIYNVLYHRSIGDDNPNIVIQSLTEVKNISHDNNQYQLNCRQFQESHEFSYATDKVILATGYHPDIPDWFKQRFNDQIEWEDDKRFKVTRNYRLCFNDGRSNHFYTATNLTHSHGTAATNLGLAVERNKMIINDIVGKEIYPVPHDTIFSQFTMRENDQT